MTNPCRRHFQRVTAAIEAAAAEPTQTMTVQGAEILNYQIKAKIYPLTTGPETELILAAAEAQLLRFAHQRRRLALEISESILHAALHVEGVRKVVLEDWVDIVATKYQAPYCTNVELALGIE
ncbi:Baseplate J-like protein [compost metagenome]